MKVAKFSAVALTVLLVSAGSTWSQKSNDELIDKLNDDIDQSSRDVADEYLDILENVSDLLDDYADYVSDMPSESADHDVKIIDVIRENLRRDAYVDNPEKLLDDLYAAIEALKEVESAHRVKFNTNNPKCCRLGRALRKELVINAELVEDYLDNHTVQVLRKDEIKKYVAEALKALKELEKAKGEFGSQAEEIQRALDALRALGLQGRVIIPEAGEAPEAPAMPTPPRYVVPDVPPVPDIPAPYGAGKKGDRKGAQHQMVGNVTASRSDWPIIIENPTGDVIITGTSAKTINVTLSLEVASTSHDKEKEYLDRAVLMVAQQEGKYQVRADLPRLSDHRTELLASTLEVSVPRANAVQCFSAYGTVSIRDVDGGVTIKGDKSTIDVSRVGGGLSVRNALGAVTAVQVSGRIGIETSYAPISLSSCDGRTVLENQYSSITMDRCEGTVEVSNTGPVEITNHVGDVNVENAYGRVEIERLEGNLTAVNGYQPLVVTNVSGSAELENAYAEISVEDVGATLSATNNNGQIFVEASPGPIELDNNYGNTSISLVRGFKGSSTITGTGGTIKLAILQEPNVTLSLHTIGGNITSSLPLSVKTRGDAKTAELILGDGSESLDISGSGSTIVIQGR